MRVYSLVDRATGEEFDTNECTVERVTGIEIYYIDGSIEQDGNWIVTKPA